MLELVALDGGAVGPEPQDRFLDDEHELAVPLEQVALPADPLGDGLGDVVDFHAALPADLGQDPGHVGGGLQQPRHHLGLVGPEQAHAFPHVAGHAPWPVRADDLDADPAVCSNPGRPPLSADIKAGK